MKKIKITCPQCKVEYEINKKDINIKMVRCIDCGHWYHQMTQGLNTIGWVKHKIMTICGS